MDSFFYASGIEIRTGDVIQVSGDEVGCVKNVVYAHTEEAEKLGVDEDGVFMEAPSYGLFFMSRESLRIDEDIEFLKRGA